MVLLTAPQALLHRAALHKPFGILKYAMTLDGKIATSMGHAAWISSPLSRQHVFETRSRSDAVVVGGQTVGLFCPLQLRCCCIVCLMQGEAKSTTRLAKRDARQERLRLDS